ncbi:MAG TPA: carboxypeptidase-like regulatory domain-containing protein [Pyrinomonadaceae bacterium]|nr:carboxypeptidase-like regulatory domain-containing protein [Pyrinomonadaceae bacterium]
MRKSFWRVSLAMLAAALVCAQAGVPEARAAGRSRLGTVTGLVRDNKGQPLAGAIIQFAKEGAGHVVKQTSTAKDGTFTARVLPGKYLLTALAQGFNSVSFNSVQVNPSDEISYRFNLEPVGQGRTAPERRTDRNDPKWRLRSAQSRRSVFQMDGTTIETVETAELEGEETGETRGDEAQATESAAVDPGEQVEHVQVFSRGRQSLTHGFLETYTAFSADPRSPAYAGTNFAVSAPAGDRLNLIFAGQLASNGLGRLETTARFAHAGRHRLSATVGGATLPVSSRAPDFRGRRLNQVSVRAVDEWIVRDGIVVVFGLDYSRLLGGDGTGSVSPRLGFQFDADARTRLRAAYAPSTATSRSQQSAVGFEGGPVIFGDAGEQTVAYVDGRAVLERSHRLEFGVERVLDNSSSVEASAFFDAVDGRGVGLLSAPLDVFDNDNGAGLLELANQRGAARGLRVVYTRRVGSRLKTSAGYSFGRGQQLAAGALSRNPAEVFRSGFFQTAAAQVDSSFDTGTRVRTVLRFSPRAAVFAIDPFAGRVAVFDPSLSILVTQELPTFGLPFAAEAVIDARNLLDAQAIADDGETVTTLNSTRRAVRGGISLRF